MAITSCDFYSSNYYISKAEKLENEGKFEEAIKLLNIAIEKDPENVFALLNRGVDKSRLGQYEDAILDYSRMIEVNPSNTLAFFNRGISKQNLENYEGAIQDFDKAIKTKGGEMLYMDKVDNPYIDNGYEFDVRMEEIRFERGIVLYYIDSLRPAFNDFNFSIEKNHEVPLSHYWRGLIYLSYGMKNEGCADLRKSQNLGEPSANEMIQSYCNQ